MRYAILLFALLLALAVPALALIPQDAQWQTQWSTGFDDLTPGAIEGQDGWATNLHYRAVNLGCEVISDLTKALSGPNRFSTGTYLYSQSASVYKSMMEMAGSSHYFYEGYLNFWMYDPVGISTTKQTISSCELYSQTFDPEGTLTPQNFLFGGMISDYHSGIGGSIDGTSGMSYYVFACGISTYTADGSGRSGAAGVGDIGSWIGTQVSGQARRRSLGWHQMQVYWKFTDTTGRFEFFVDDMTVPCITVDMTNGSNRWRNLHGVAGLYLGNPYNSHVVSKPADIDDVSFYAVPEPSSLLALGGGLAGLLGLARRRNK